MAIAAERLAEFAAELAFDDLQWLILRKAKHHILDMLGICLAASQLPYTTRLSTLVRQ
jgi:2-methylcitrate dehydratase PrpD